MQTLMGYWRTVHNMEFPMTGRTRATSWPAPWIIHASKMEMMPAHQAFDMNEGNLATLNQHSGFLHTIELEDPEID